MSEKPRIRANADGTYRLDAWANVASGAGMPGYDKSVYDRFGFAGSRIDWQTLSMMYRYDWLARKICDRPALDAVRRWITTEDKAALDEMERLRFKKRVKQAISWSRLYGGAAILLIVDDGLTPSDPLDPSRVRRIIDTPAVDRHHLQPTGEIVDVYAVRYGEPEYYQTNNGTMFHHSRVLQFRGADLTDDQAATESMWGGSYIELYKDAVKSFHASMQDARHIMTESSVGIVKIPGLTTSVAAGGKIFDAIQRRLDQFNLSKSLYRVAAMDAEEEFDYRQRQLTGLSELLDRFMTQVAGATDMPELVLFGTTPGGLNASQEEQLAVYYDMVRSIQEDDMMAAIDAFMACFRRGDIPDWDYRPLMEPSDQAKAEIRQKEANAIAQVAQYLALPPEDIVRHLNRTGHFDLPDDYPDADGILDV